MTMDYLQYIARTGKIDLGNDWDNFFCFSGDEGSGKSTVAQKLAKLLDPKFTFDNIVYGFKDFESRVYSLPPGASILHDELGKSAFNRDAMKKVNKEIVKMAMVCRDQNKSLLSCIPNFWWLDPYLRDHRTRYWFHVETGEIYGVRTRGWMQIRKKPVNSSMWGNTPYWPLVCRYRFKPMPAEAYAIYKAHKRERIAALKDEDDDDDRQSNQKYRDACIKNAYAEKVPVKYIAKVFSITSQRVSQIAGSK